MSIRDRLRDLRRAVEGRLPPPAPPAPPGEKWTPAELVGVGRRGPFVFGTDAESEAFSRKLDGARAAGIEIGPQAFLPAEVDE